MKGIISGVLIGGALVISISATAQNGLIISEVTDPADDYNGRFIELFNAGNELIDFSTSVFFLSRQSNGGTSWGDVQLTGSVGPGEVYVIGGSGFEALYGFTPDLVTGILIGNGDDAYSLFSAGDHVSGLLHDIYGEIDVDGTGTLWEYTDSRAVRVDSIISANPVWSAAEWEITPANIADCDPGTHAGSNGNDTITTPGNFVLAVPDTLINGIQPVNIPVLVSSLTAGDQIISYQFDIEFDPAVLDYKGYSLSGTIAEGGTLEVNTGNPGKLSIGYMNTFALTGSGPLLVLQFDPLVLDTSGLILSNAWLNNLPVQQLTQGRVIIVEGEPPTVAINYSDTVNRFADTLIITAIFSEPMDPAVPVGIDLTGAVISGGIMNQFNDTVYIYYFPVPKADGIVNVSLSSGADLSGNEVVPDPVIGATFAIMPFRPGDVDDDGLILAYDAALTLQYSVGLDPLPLVDPIPWVPWRDSTANVDGTGTITAYDAGLILQYAAGIIIDFINAGNKGTGTADVIIKLEDHAAVFYSDGELFGLNVEVTDADGIPGEPVVLDDNFISAFNITGSTYKIGLCTGISPEEGEAFMKIPLMKSSRVTFSMMINNTMSEATVDESTGIIDYGSERIKIYPNPVIDRVRINGLAGSGIVTVFSSDGILIFREEINRCSGEIDLSDMRSGVYILIVEDEKEAVSRRVVKK